MYEKSACSDDREMLVIAPDTNKGILQSDSESYP